MRGPASDAQTLPNISLSTTIYDIKTLYAQKTGLQAEKVKLLLNKKPAADLKTLKDLGVVDGAKDVELSVMVMGGTGNAGSAAATPRSQSPAVTEKAPAPAATAPDPMDIDEKTSAPESEKAAAEAEAQAPAKTESGGAEELLATEEFWDDLKGFLSQRLRDEEMGAKLSQTFRAAWKK
jgi:hypothetical protein